MTPKQARLGVDIFTAAVVASVAIALASLTWRLQGYTGLSTAAAPVAPGLAGTDVAPILALAPFGQATGEGIAGSAAGLELRAIFAAEPAAASVALIALSDGQVIAYAIGEATPGGIVESIEPEKVMLRAVGGLRVLGFNPQDTAPATVVTTPAVAQTLPAAPVTAASSSPSGVAAIRSLIPQSAQTGSPASQASVPPAAPTGDTTTAPGRPGLENRRGQ